MAVGKKVGFYALLAMLIIGLIHAGLVSIVHALDVGRIPGGSEVPGFRPVIVYVNGGAPVYAKARVGLSSSLECEVKIQPPTIDSLTLILPIIPLPLNGSLVNATLVPALPAAIVRFTVVKPGVPPSTTECRLKLEYVVEVRIYGKDGEEIGSTSFKVVPPGESIDLPPLVFVAVPGSGWLGSSPRYFAIPDTSNVRVYVVALDDDKEPQPTLYVDEDGVRRAIQPVVIPELSEALRKLRSWLEDVYDRINEWLSRVVNGNPPSLPKPVLGVYAGLVELGGKAGQYIEYYAVVKEDGKEYASQVGGFVVYNSSANTRVLVIDSRMPLYLLYKSYRVDGGLVGVRAWSAWGIPSRLNKLLADAVHNISMILEHVAVRPRWDNIAYRYSVLIVPPSRELCDILEDYAPDTIIIAFTPTGIATGLEPIDRLTNGDLSKIMCRNGVNLLEKLLRYVQERHAGLIATMGAINGFEVANCDLKNGDVEWIELGPIGHIGRSLEDANPIQPKSLAAALGFPILTLLEYAKRLVTEKLCNLAHYYYIAGDAHTALALAAVAEALGSTPIATYSPFNGTRIVFNLEPFRSRVGVISFERRMPTIVRALGFTGYALLGWQLQKPYSMFNHTWAAVRRLLDKLNVKPEELAHLLRNITRILERTVRVEINETSLAEAYIHALRGLLERLHNSIASVNTTLDGRIVLSMSLPGYNTLANITLNLSRLIDKLMSYTPPRIAALSSDRLGAVLLYDPAWLPNGYRAVLITFEAELLDGEAGRRLWKQLVEWSKGWRYAPELYVNISGLIIPRDLYEEIRSLADRLAAGAKRIANYTLLVPETGYAKLNVTLREGHRVVLVIAHPDSEKINVTLLAGNARIVEIVEGKRATGVIIAGDGRALLGIRADPDSVLCRAYVEEYEEKATQTTTPGQTFTTITKTITITKTVTRTTTTTTTTTVTKTVERSITRTTTTTITMPGKTVTTTVTSTTTVTLKAPKATVTFTLTKFYTTTLTETITRTREVTKSETITRTTTVTSAAINTPGGLAALIAALVAGATIGFTLGRRTK